VKQQRLPHRPDIHHASDDLMEVRPSQLARVGGGIVAVVALGAAVAAAMVGLVTFAFIFVSLGIIFLLLLIFALLFGRGRVYIHINRGNRVESKRSAASSRVEKDL
jgi:hypothetical protein